MKNKTTLVIGASPNPERFSHKAVKLLKRKGYKVIPVGRRKGEIEGIPILLFDEQLSLPIHTLSIYLSPGGQKQWYEYLTSLKPRRVIFNPGTENEELEDHWRKRGVEIIKNCNIKMLLNDIY